MNEEFRQLDDELKTLTPLQQRQYDFLSDDPEEAEATRRFCEKVLRNEERSDGPARKHNGVV